MTTKNVFGCVKAVINNEIKSYTKDGKRFIEGYASTKDVDRVNDIVLPSAFEKTMAEYMQKNPILLYNHDFTNPIGKIVAYKIDDNGLFVVAELGRDFEPADTVWKMIEQGILRSFSIGFSVKDEEYNKEGKRLIKEVDLYEISIVSVPANTNAVFDMCEDGKCIGLKMITESEDVKAVEPYVDLPVVDAPWNKYKAIKQIRKWASSDGSGDEDKIRWSKYKKCFMWYDENDPEKFGSYKLPFCYIEDGKPVACKRAIMAIAAVLQGARGGVNIPEKDKEKVKKVVERYYKKWNDVPPWKR